MSKRDKTKEGSIAQIREFLEAKCDLDYPKGKLKSKEREKIQVLRKLETSEIRKTRVLLRRDKELRRALEAIDDMIHTNCVHIWRYRTEINEILHTKGWS